MNKSSYFFGQSVFGQLISLIDSSLIRGAVKKHNSDHYVKKFDTLKQSVCKTTAIQFAQHAVFLFYNLSRALLFTPIPSKFAVWQIGFCLLVKFGRSQLHRRQGTGFCS
ncbi:DUF4372 domain-containing protein [Flavobacterium aurantiibacter]|uniref:DUF4372 domain-containing protein n=1 Tax=Flavobacterium aurantiibacter TaxID=2023067 RepID=A0A255ZQG1_9FLAO|nr:DUF4372 domain-containing protein [Flavobacterium aurantiibacter]OYQ42920.1 hypothetical protein CHX27_11135 [Flavobacterium aurantiibacter]